MKSAISAILACLAVAGCGPSDGAKRLVDANRTTSEVRQDLFSVGLGYYGAQSGAFNTQDTVVVPCEPLRLKAINQSVAQLISLQKRLQANGQESEATDVRENFLVSLLAIQGELNHFCSEDFEKINSCLGKGQVLVFLNKQQQGFAPVSPVLIPFPAKTTSVIPIEYGIYRISYGGQWLDFVSIDVKSKADPKKLDPDVEASFLENIEKLVEMDKCVSSQNVQTATGKQIQRFLSLAAQKKF